jgi:hypothetical protein
MQATLLTADEYKASLPKAKYGIAWSMDTFATYVNLLYPHIIVKENQKWNGALAKYLFSCQRHGDYEARAEAVISSAQGCMCRSCAREIRSSLAGKRRNPRATLEERERACTLFSELGTYAAVARILGRSDETIRRWLDPKAADSSRHSSESWKQINRDQHNSNNRRYRREFDHGKAAARSGSAAYRVLKQNTPEFVFLDGEWHEVDRRETWRVFSEVLLPAKERKEIQELYLEAQYLTETTGVEHHVDHIQPLSKGGEHLMYNLQILTAAENLSKYDSFREEDQIEFCRRLFN